MRQRLGLAAPVLLAAAALAGCGTASPTDSAASSTDAGSSVRPLPEETGCDPVPDVPSARPDADAPPDYASNHRFQQKMNLCDEDLERGQAEERRTIEALTVLSHRERADAAAVRAALVGLGHEEQAIRVRAEAGLVVFGVDLAAPACLDGTVSPETVEVEASGIYLDGGCVMPELGH